MYTFILNYIFIPQAYAMDIHTLVGRINHFVINPIIAILFALAFVMFVTGLFSLFSSGKESEEALAKGKRHITWGLIGMVIMVSVFGIMNFILHTLEVQGINPEEGTVDIPWE